MRVFVVDSHPVVRAGLRQIVNTASDMIVVGESDSCQGVPEKISGGCDLLILDGELESTNFLRVFHKTRQKGRPPFVLVMSRHSEGQHAIQMIRAGANGFVSKSMPPKVILEAIRKVSTGGKYFSRELSDAMLFDMNRMNKTVRLSVREYEVLRLLATGFGVVQIAAHLSLSVKTVSTYRSRLLEKLNLRTTAELIRYALKEQLVD